MLDRHPTLFATLAASTEAEANALKALYETNHVVLEDEKAEQFAVFSNQQKMHYKIHAADSMARAIDEFDLYVRLRPDLEVMFTAFDWQDLTAAAKSRPVLFAEKPFGLHYGHLMIGDQFAVAAPETMQIYAGTWKSFLRVARAGLTGCPNDFTGHVSLGFTCWTQGVKVERAPVKFGRLLEARPMESSDILAALEADSRGDAIDQRLIEAVQRDLNT